MANEKARSLSRSELRRLLRSVLPSAADLNAFCLDYFDEVHSRFDEGMDAQSKLNLLLALEDCANIESRLRIACPDRVSRYLQHLNVALSSREQRERGLAEQLRQLLADRETLRRYENRQIEREIADAQAALRRGPRMNPGEVLGGRFQLETKQGDGYYAEVWEAINLKLDPQVEEEKVAVKILHGKHSGDTQQLKRFSCGALRMKTLAHKNILRVFTEIAEHEGFYYFVIELMCGGDLRQAVLRGETRLKLPLHIQAVLQVGDALHHAHSRGLIHRDVKPANILLDSAGNARLTDFDLVLDEKERLTQSHAMLGTLGYAAPEQLEDGYRVDQRADVYALGRTALFVIHGRELPRQWFGPHQGYLEEVEASSQVREVLRCATAWSPDSRFPTVSAFCEAFRSALSSPSSGSLHRTAPAPLPPIPFQQDTTRLTLPHIVAAPLPLALSPTSAPRLANSFGRKAFLRLQKLPYSVQGTISLALLFIIALGSRWYLQPSTRSLGKNEVLRTPGGQPDKPSSPIAVPPVQTPPPIVPPAPEPAAAQGPATPTVSPIEPPVRPPTQEPAKPQKRHQPQRHYAQASPKQPESTQQPLKPKKVIDSKDLDSLIDSASAKQPEFTPKPQKPKTMDQKELDKLLGI